MSPHHLVDNEAHPGSHRLFVVKGTTLAKRKDQIR